jgi:hypothetical protein
MFKIFYLAILATQGGTLKSKNRSLERWYMYQANIQLISMGGGGSISNHVFLARKN